MGLRRRIIESGLGVIGATRIHRLAAPMLRGVGAVLMFHHVRPAATDGFAPNALLEITPGFLDAVLTHLAERGYEVVTLDDLLERLRAGARLRRPAAVLTFDDGYRDNRDHALPVLQARGVRAMLFVVAGLIGKTDEWDHPNGEPPQRLMDASQIRAWLAAGHEIGAHTLTHPHLAEIAPAQARAEIFESKARLEDEFGVPVRHFCYPYGNFDARVRDFVAEAGYETATAAATDTDTFGPNHPGVPPLALRRVMACNRPSLARSVARKVARLVRRPTGLSPT